MAARMERRMVVRDERGDDAGAGDFEAECFSGLGEQSRVELKKPIEVPFKMIH